MHRPPPVSHPVGALPLSYTRTSKYTPTAMPKPPKPGTYRPLNPPRPITVEAAGERPVALVDRDGERVAVARIEESWVIDEEW